MDGIPLGVLNQVGVVGLFVGLFWMLATGRLCTARELREKNQRIEALETMVSTRDQQISLMLSEALPTVSTVLAALHNAAEEKS